MHKEFYQVAHDLRSGYWPEPLTAGEIVQMAPETADLLDRCSPGVLNPWTPPPPIVAAPAPPIAASAPETDSKALDDDLPDHVPAPVKRGPGRPAKAAAPISARHDR